jgi:hypothetical protein
MLGEKPLFISAEEIKHEQKLSPALESLKSCVYCAERPSRQEIMSETKRKPLKL